MRQRVSEPTRCREEPSQLDLVFTKTPESRPNNDCLSPLGRSNHVIKEIESGRKSVAKERTMQKWETELC